MEQGKYFEIANLFLFWTRGLLRADNSNESEILQKV